MIATTLRGHLLAILMYVETPQEMAQARRHLARLDQPNALWTPQELRQIHTDFIEAMRRDEEWEEKRRAWNTKGRKVWSLKSMVALVNENFEARLSTNFKNIAASAYAAMRTRVPKGYRGLLMIARGMLPEDVERFIHDIVSQTSSEGKRKSGQVLITREQLITVVRERRAQNPPLPVDVPSLAKHLGDSVLSLRVKIKRHFPDKEGPWIGLLKQAGLSGKEIYQCRQESLQSAAKRAVVTRGDTFWDEARLRQFVLEQYDADPSLSTLLAERTPTAAQRKAIKLAGTWDDMVGKILAEHRGLTVDEVKQSMQQLRTKIKREVLKQVKANQKSLQ
jgi:hypothetical protein